MRVEVEVQSQVEGVELTNAELEVGIDRIVFEWLGCT